MKRHNRRVERFIWEKGPVAKAILCSYLLVLLLPLVLTVTLTAIGVARMQEQSEQHLASAATELSRLMDAYVEEIQTENKRILFSDEVKKLSMLRADHINKQHILQLRSLQRRLPIDTVASDYIRAIYVCFLKSDTVLTAGSVYYDYNAGFMLRDQLGMSLEYWMQYLHSVTNERVSLIAGDLDRRPHFLVAKRYAPQGKSSDVVVISEFSSEKAVRLMNDFSENGELIHSLMDENGNVLSASYRADENRHYTELLTPLRTNNGDLPLFLKTQAPGDRFLRQMMPLLVTVLLGFLFFLVLGFFLIHYLARRQYTPIEQLNSSLLVTLNRNTAEGRHTAAENEFDQMSEAVSNLLKTNATSREENQLLRNRLRRHLLQSMLHGNIRKEAMILRHAENNGIQFAGRRVLVVLYAIEDMQQSEQSHMLMQNADAFSHLDEMLRTAITPCSENGLIRHAVEVEEQVACIVSIPDAVGEEIIQKDVQDNIQRLREFFRNSFGIILTASVSRVHSGVVSIPTCFRECREAAEYRELIGAQAAVCCYDQLPAAADEALSFSEVLEKEKKLCRNLATGDYQSAIAAWHELLEALSLRKCHAQEARARLLGAVSLMASALGDMGDLTEMNETSEQQPKEQIATLSTEQLQRLPDLDSMLRAIDAALAALADLATQTQTPNENPTELQFIRYVNEHLTDPSLSISVIADHFNMSTSYFSKRFKKASGENLLDYIHRERLVLVKQMMREQPDKTLKEICDLVGYTSPLTLNRAFRKYEGITPSDYRARL